LDRVTLIMNWTSGTRQIVDLVDFEMYRLCHIMPHNLETIVCEEMKDILTGSRKEVVEAENLVAFRKEPLAEV
jgi:hypothetical protein